MMSLAPALGGGGVTGITRMLTMTSHDRYITCFDPVLC